MAGCKNGKVLRGGRCILVGITFRPGFYDSAIAIDIFIADDLYDCIRVSCFRQLDHGDILTFGFRNDILQDEHMGVALFFSNDLYIIDLAVTVEVKVVDTIILGIYELFQFLGTAGLFKHIERALQTEIIAGKTCGVRLYVLSPEGGSPCKNKGQNHTYAYLFHGAGVL
jgi:hypothetical protein